MIGYIIAILVILLVIAFIASLIKIVPQVNTILLGTQAYI